MKTFHLSIILIGLLLIATSCTQKHTLSESKKESIEDSARTVINNVFNSINKLDFNTALKYYSTDMDARYAENGVLHPSFAAMQKSYKDFASTLDKLEKNIDKWDLTVLSPDAVAFTLQLHFKIKAKGKPEYYGQSVLNGIVQRRNGRWVIIQSHESWLNYLEVVKAITP